MEIYIPLPDQLYSRVLKDVPQYVTKRLRYLWISAHECLGTSLDNISLSHHLSRSFMESVLEQGITLTEEYMNRLCQKCCVLQVPSLTCRSRLRSRTKQSNCNRKIVKKSTNTPSAQGDKKSNRLKSELIRTCLVCQHISKMKTGFSKKKRNINQTNEVLQSVTEKPAVRIDESKNKIVSTPSKRFSFHDSLQRRLSAPAKLNGISGDYVPLGATGEKKFLNLLEREKLNKKLKKRKTFDGQGINIEGSGDKVESALLVSCVDKVEANNMTEDSCTQIDTRSQSELIIPIRNKSRKLHSQGFSSPNYDLGRMNSSMSSLASLKDAFKGFNSHLT